MIFYTIQSNTNFNEGDIIQRLNNTISLNDGTGLILGIVMKCNQIEDTLNYEVVVYVAGGGGLKIRLSSDWDGQPSRFEFKDNGVSPTSSTGDGWLIPDYPATSYVVGDLVSGAVYK